MKYLLFVLLSFCAINAEAAQAWSKTITSSSTTPTLQDLSTSTSRVTTLELTVGSGDTCLAEFSATPGAQTSGGNWQPVANLSSITASATATLTRPVVAVRVTATVGTNPCQLDIAGVAQ